MLWIKFSMAILLRVLRVRYSFLSVFSFLSCFSVERIYVSKYIDLLNSIQSTNILIWLNGFSNKSTFIPSVILIIMAEFGADSIVDLFCYTIKYHQLKVISKPVEIGKIELSGVSILSALYINYIFCVQRIILYAICKYYTSNVKYVEYRSKSFV